MFRVMYMYEIIISSSLNPFLFVAACLRTYIWWDDEIIRAKFRTEMKTLAMVIRRLYETNA